MQKLLLALAATLITSTALATPQQVKVRADSGVVQVQDLQVVVGGEDAIVVDGGIVTVAKGGHATVTFPDGCTAEVTETMVIPKESPCATAANVKPAPNTGLIVAGIAGLAGVAAASGGGNKKGTPSSP